MDDNDPINQFFPGQDDVDLYAVINLERSAGVEDIKRSYRRLALVYHPDKHATASQQAKEEASIKFQQIGFAYAVLSDKKRRARYDSTGKTDEGFDLGAGEDGWETYFEELFDRVTRGKLDEMKKEYQGSSEEIEDLRFSYETTGGSLGEMMTYIPHSTLDDDSRFISIINDLIKRKELKETALWKASSKDEKSRQARKKASEKEAKEAEAMAKELGVWNEFYGDGKPSERKRFKGKAKVAEDETEDHSALQALILKKKQKNMDGFFDSLAGKYSDPSKTGSRGKGKRRAVDDSDESIPTKKSRSDLLPPEIDDEEFTKIQERLFGDKVKISKAGQKLSSRKGQ